MILASPTLQGVAVQEYEKLDISQYRMTVGEYLSHTVSSTGQLVYLYCSNFPL